MAKLPYAPTATEYGFSPAADFAEVELEGGAPRQRATVVGGWGKVPVRWVLSPTEYAAFWTFYDANRAVQFTIDLITRGAKAEHPARWVRDSRPQLTEKNGQWHIVEGELWVGSAS